jgi:hypothetical protein
MVRGGFIKSINGYVKRNKISGNGTASVKKDYNAVSTGGAVITKRIKPLQFKL